MLTELRGNELIAVNGGLSQQALGGIVALTGGLINTLITAFHMAGDDNDPNGKGKNAIFTERTVNIITFSLSTAATLVGFVGGVLVIVAEDKVKKI